MMNNDFKLQAYSIEAEQAVIGSLLFDNDAYDQIHSLQASAFYQHGHLEMFRSISEMMQERKPIDIVTLAEHLDKRGKLNEIGGISYLTEIVQSRPTSANIKRYAEIVQEKATLRALQSAINTIQQDIYSYGEISQKLERAQGVIMAITEHTQSSEPQFVGDLMPARMERYDAIFSGEIKQIGTGLIDLDTKIGGGLEGGQLVVIAARPAMGKSALAVQLAENIQDKDGAAIIFSCEMPNAQIVDRIISAQARIPSDRLRSGKFTEKDFDGMVASIPKLKNMNLLVDDKAFTINAIASKSRTIKRKYGLSLIVIDYLQLLDGIGETREQQISSISRGLKKLAIELDVPVVALSQLNRGLEQRANKRPVMSDIRESGAIEQDADLIFGIYRDEEYNPDTTDKGTAELLILKNRSGATGRIRLTYIGEFTRFENFEGVHFSEPKKEAVRYRKGFED